MANNFLVYKSFNVGKSLVEENTGDIIKDIYKEAKLNNCEILIPDDCMVGKNFDGNGKNKNLDEVQDEEIILDIGINTIKNKKKLINLIQFYGMDRLVILKILTFQKVLCPLQRVSRKILLKNL